MAIIPYTALIRLKSVYRRITLTRTTLAFFILTFVLCFTQGLIQSFLYSTDAEASHLVTSILDTAGVPYRSEFAWLQRLPAEGGGERFFLSLCTRLPHGDNPGNCTAVFDSAAPGVGSYGSAGARRAEVAGDASGREVIRADPAPHFDASGRLDGVSLAVRGSDRVVFLSERCTRVLVYPDQVFKNAKREELAFIGSQFWLFGASTYAILYESVPHLIAVIVTRVMMTAWSAYAIWRNKDIAARMAALVSGPDTACQADLFPAYFKQRQAFEIPDVILGMTALVFLVWFSLRLITLYSQHTFQHVCPTPEILRVYRTVMAVCAALQLSAQFALASSALWLDQLLHGAIGSISSHTPIYKAQIIFLLIVLLPWIITGWYAFTRELRWASWTFVGCAFVVIATWSVLFYSRVYRWTFVNWPFFASMTVAAFMSIVAAGVFGVCCVLCFGRGLRQFLHASNTLAKIGFEPEVFTHAPHGDVEKAPVPFPPLTRGDTPPPTFMPSFSKEDYDDDARSLESHFPPGIHVSQ